MPSPGSDGSTIVGDASQRVTVPLPRSLDDLKSQAQRHFRGNQGLYHHGKHKMAQAAHVAGLRDGDVIVVAKADERREAPAVSTQHDHYIKHPLDVRAPVMPKQVAKSSARFEGSTNYASDFVEHPVERSQPAKPAKSYWEAGRKGDPTGPTTYQMQYPWHDPKKPAQHKPQEQPRDVGPFEGVTSYGADYVKHPLRPRTNMAPPGRSVTPGNFEGETTYSLDYKKHLANSRVPKHPGYGATLKPESGPFEGSSEYTREYLKHQMERRPVVHIEPEVRKHGRSTPSSRPGSAPPGVVRHRRS